MTGTGTVTKTKTKTELRLIAVRHHTRHKKTLYTYNSDGELREYVAPTVHHPWYARTNKRFKFTTLKDVFECLNEIQLRSRKGIKKCRIGKMSLESIESWKRGKSCIWCVSNVAGRDWLR